MHNLKKYTQKDRYGNMFSFEFNVPSLQEIPKPMAEETTNVTVKAIKEGINPAGFKPKGTDTVPAMLTPGENIVNAEASRLPGVQGMLDKLNDKGRAIQKQQGGPIPSYNSRGAKVDYYGNDYNQSTINAEISTLKGMGLSDVQIIQALMNNLNMSQGEAQSALMPTYKQEGGVITDEMMPSVLDGMRMVESGGDVNAVSEVGAAGPYQIMKATGLKPGYGVEAISGADRFNEIKSREFAKQYLKGIMKAHPNFTKDEVITAYHSGVGNVLKAKGGVEDLGPRGQSYAPKVNEAMNNIVTFDATPIEPGMFSAMASTGNENKKPELVINNNRDPYSYSAEEFSSEIENKKKENKKKYGENVELDGVGNVVNPDIPKPYSEFGLNEVPSEALAESYVNNEISTEEYDAGVAMNKQKDIQKDAYNKEIELQNKKENLNNNAAINSQIKSIDEQIAEAKKKGDNLLVSALEKKKNNLEKDIVDIEPTQEEIDKKKEADEQKKKETAQAISNQLANEEDIDQTVMTNEEVVQWMKDNPGKTPTDKFIDKAKEVGGVILDKSMEYFKNAFSSMFNGEELARMALIYAGSRAMGYDHGASLNYGMKNYIKRVDANLAAAKKFSLTDKAREDYTEKSLKEFAKTGDRDVLERKAGGTTMTQTSGSAYLRGVGKVQKYKDANGVEYVGIGGKYAPVTAVSQYLEPWDESVQGNKAIETKFGQYSEEAIKVANDKFGLSQGTKNKTSYDTRAKINNKRIGQEANRAYRDIIRRNSLSVNDTLGVQASISTAIDKYTNDLAKYKADRAAGNDEAIKPMSLDGYITQEVRIPLTGLDVTLFGTTTTANINELDNRIRREMDIKDTRNPEFTTEYKESWKLNELSWKGLDDATRAKWEKRAAEKKGWSGFTLWASRTSAEEKAKTID